MRRRVLAAAACLVLAAAALVLARDVWHVEKALRDGDARAAAGAAGPGSWRAAHSFPADAARRLLQVDDDVAFRTLYARALALSREEVTEEDARRRTPVEVALRRLVLDDRHPLRAARAANVLGVLLYTDPDDPELSPAQRALGEFQSAVLLEPGNDVAKANLELLLRQLRSQSPSGRSSPGGGDQAGSSGVGQAPAGDGF